MRKTSSSPFASQLPYKERKKASGWTCTAVHVRLHSVFPDEMSRVYREVLHTRPPGQWGMQGDPGILQDPHNVFKGIKLVYYSVLLLHIVLGSPIGNMFLRRTNPECVQSKS